jgi:pimeloyl-ACP methyl ester carboxylesterase
LVVIVFGLLLAVMLVVAMAFTLLMPQRMTDGRAAWILKRTSPHDLGLAFVDQRWTVREQRTGRPMTIAGWWIPTVPESDKTAVVIHGYGDAKVGGIAWAPLLRELGFNVLAIDLRAHGQSEGLYSTAACWERFDVTQVLDQVLAERPEATRRVVVLGVSLGAAVSAAVAGMRDDVSATILECPYSSYRRAIRSHAERSGMPGRMFQRAATRLAEWIARADFDSMSPVKTIGGMKCPVMVIQSGDDPLVTSEDAAQIEAAVRARPAESGPNVYWAVPTARHVMAMSSFPDDYKEQVAAFLSAAMGKRPSAAAAPEMAGKVD